MQTKFALISIFKDLKGDPFLGVFNSCYNFYTQKSPLKKTVHTNSTNVVKRGMKTNCLLSHYKLLI